MNKTTDGKHRHQEMTSFRVEASLYISIIVSANKKWILNAFNLRALSAIENFPLE